MRPGIVSGRFSWHAPPARQTSTTKEDPGRVTHVISSLPAVGAVDDRLRLLLQLSCEIAQLIE